MKPSTPEYVDWMALRLVHDGGVVKYRGAYLDGGQPLPKFLLLEFLLDALLTEGRLALAQPDKYGTGAVVADRRPVTEW